MHLVLWTPLILGGAILMLRPLKAGLIALQYRHDLLHPIRPERMSRHVGFRPRRGRRCSRSPVVLLCVGLGVWQLERLEWKRGLIAQREAAVARRADRAAAHPRRGRALEFRPVVAEGVFLNDKEIYPRRDRIRRRRAGFTC